MDDHNDIIGIFDASGCLSERGLTLFSEGHLNESLQKKVKQHLAGCELCSAAQEGWALLLQQKGLPGLETMVLDIQKGIDEKVIEAKTKTHRLPGYRAAWVASAASMVILIGFYFVIRNYTKTVHEELAQKITKAQETASLNLDTITDGKQKESSSKFVPTVVVTDSLFKESQLNQELTVSDNNVTADFSVTEKVENAPIEKETIYEKDVKGIVGNKSEMKVIEDMKAGGVALQDKPPGAVRMENKALGYSVSPVKKKQVVGQMPEKEDQSPLYTVVEQMPSFPGGQDSLNSFISRNLRYPQTAKESGVQGTVYVSFIVDSKGRVKEPQITRGIGSGCDEEALRVFRMMPAWLPGRQAGKPVDTQFTMPVKFSLY